MKRTKDGFVDSRLVTIKDKLFETGTGEDDSGSDAEQAPKTHVAPAPERGTAEVDLGKEYRRALQKRWDEFRLTKRDVTGRIAEKLASIPEDIKISEKKIQELNRAVEKLASVLDSIQSIDDSTWKGDNLPSELASAMKKVENARLEFIRVNARISALQRESDAAEMESGVSLLPELKSLTFAQLFKFGLVMSLPVVLALALAATIIAVAIYMTFRVQ